MTAVAAYVFAALSGVTALFQLTLAAGAPWGDVSMGGRFPGTYPAPMRAAAVGFAVVAAGLAAVVMSRAGLALQSWRATSEWLIWVIVAYSAVGLIMNLATPVKRERVMWAPVAFGLLASSGIVALS